MEKDEITIFGSDYSRGNEPTDEELIRLKISHIWGKDWDSGEDSIYDLM